MQNRSLSLFINYRRGDTIDQARALHSAFQQAFRTNLTVFLDEKSVALTEDWKKKIRSELDRSDVVLSLIGPDWIRSIENRANDREELPEKEITDWVLYEIGQAAAARIDVVPVFIQLDQVPPANKILPADFEATAARVFNGQGFVIRKNAQEEGFATIIDSLKQYLGWEGDDYRTVSALDPLADLPLDEDKYLDKLLDFLDEKEEQEGTKIGPYLGPTYYDDTKALLYAGRNWDIRDLFHAIRRNKLVHLHGYSGSGKSSLLHAGLLPRMQDIEQWEVLEPIRRSKEKGGLAAQLKVVLTNAGKIPEDKKRLVVLDQVEEMLLDPLETEMEMKPLGRQLQELYDLPSCHVVLSFRSEFLSKITVDFLRKYTRNLRGRGRELYLKPLGAAQMEEAIRQPCSVEVLQNQFKLSFAEPDLPEQIARDFRGDTFYPFTVLFQIQMQALWKAALEKNWANAVDGYRISETLYKQHRQKDIPGFITDQLAELRRINASLSADGEIVLDEDWKNAVDNGLVLDVLYQYISVSNSTESAESAKSDLRDEAVAKDYQHLYKPSFDQLLQQLRRFYLLSWADGNQTTTRLAHDTLAGPIRRMYEESNRIGQRARRYYEAKEKALQAGKSQLFSEAEARDILEGRYAMKAIPTEHLEALRKDLAVFEHQRQERFDLAFHTARQNIEHLAFPKALENLQIAQREGIEQDQVRELALELLIPFSESGQNESLNVCQRLVAELAGTGEAVPGEATSRLGLRSLPQQWHPYWGEQQKRFYPHLVEVKGGAFDMGSEKGYSDEKPVHRVRVSDFWMADTPVTCWQFGLYCLERDIELPSDSGFGRGDRPVINVNWYEALRYCNWLSTRLELDPVYELEGNEVSEVHWNRNGFRLPTEAEWEYAARERGRAVRFGNGKDIADPGEMNFDAGHPYNEQYNKDYYVLGKGRKRTTPVKKFTPNGLGFYDMSGNVNEWCWDRWSEGDYYRESAGATDPTGPETSEEKRLVRGGSWFNLAFICRASYRYWYYPLDRINYIGFRVVRR